MRRVILIVAIAWAALLVCMLVFWVTTLPTPFSAIGIGPTPTPTVILSPQGLVREFWTHGLTATAPKDMLPHDYGAAPALCKGVQFTADTLDMDSVKIPYYGYAFVCDDYGDMVTLKKHYDELSKVAGMFATYTYTKGHYMVVIDGNVKKDAADKYGRALP